MSRLIVVWLGLGALLLGLYWWDSVLERDSQALRDPRNRIGRLIRAEERDALEIAAISVGRGDGPRHLFTPIEGVWRCPTWQDALVAKEQVDALLKALLEAEGMARSSDPARASDYGIGGSAGLRVQLHGPALLKRADRDVRLEIEFGTRQSDGDGGYVRRADHPAIWSIDTDPWTPLNSPVPGSPPLLDPHVVPRIWPGESRRVDRLVIEHDGGPKIELTLHEVQVSEEEMRTGKLSYRFEMQVDGNDTPVHDRHAMSYLGYLFGAPWQEILPGRRAAELGLEAPAARVSLFPAKGEMCQLWVGSDQPEGGVPVLNLTSGSLFLMARDAALALAPPLELLLLDSQEDVWQRWQQRR